VNPQDFTTAASIATGLLAVLGTIVAKVLEQKTKQLSADLHNESELRAQLLGRIERLEFALNAAAAREAELRAKVGELELCIRDKESAQREITLRYEALREAHRELSERYKFSEQQNRKLRDEMLAWYISDRRHTPIPPAYPPGKMGGPDD
jgi:chromosome segregation ATPase